MYLRYFALLGVIALKDVSSYSAHRSPRLATVKNLGPQEIVIPARYKIKAKPNNDPNIGQNIHTDGFPEVEYPSSIMESSRPFYLDVSPFSNDVKTSFKSLVTGGQTKSTPTIVVNLKRNDNRKENSTTNATGTQKLDVNEVTIAKGNKINSNDNGANENVNKESLTSEDDTHKKLSTLPPVEECDCDEMDYVIGIIDDLDDFISTLTAIETEIIDINNCTTKVFDSDHPKEFVTITSDVTSENNDSANEFNEGSLHTEPNPLLDESKDSSSSTLTDDDVTEPCTNETQDESDDNENIAIESTVS